MPAMRRRPLPPNFIWDSYLDTPNQQWLRVDGKTVACVSFHNGKWRSRVNIQQPDFARERMVVAPNRELGAAWAERWAMARAARQPAAIRSMPRTAPNAPLA